jgi:enolase-phosphatase E1
MMHSVISHILLDIEGTTCPVSFVSDVLFPYAQREVAGYLERHQQDAEVQRLMDELRLAWQQEEDAEAQELLSRHASPTTIPSTESGATMAQENSLDRVRALLPYLEWLIAQDRKQTAWKDLQGRIWQEGYARGELKANLYPEAAVTLQRWKEEGLQLAVYSSGSVAAQQLLYGHCPEGDLRPLFSHWFDTRIGPKQQAQSYERILEVLEAKPASVLFVSDSVAELRAAASAGMQVVFSRREGNPQVDPCGYASISSLADLDPQASGAIQHTQTIGEHTPSHHD